MKNLKKITHNIKFRLGGVDDDFCGVYIDEDAQTVNVIFKDVENDPNELLNVKFVLPTDYYIAKEE